MRCEGRESRPPVSPWSFAPPTSPCISTLHLRRLSSLLHVPGAEFGALLILRSTAVTFFLWQKRFCKSKYVYSPSTNVSSIYWIPLCIFLFWLLYIQFATFSRWGYLGKWRREKANLEVDQKVAWRGKEKNRWIKIRNAWEGSLASLDPPFSGSWERHWPGGQRKAGQLWLSGDWIEKYQVHGTE